MGQIWDRQAGENNRWYERFEKYRLAGITRSVLSIYNGERVQQGQRKSSTVPRTWNAASNEWKWRERAEAWDAHLQQQRRDEDEQMRQKSRQLRQVTIQALQSLLGRVVTVHGEKVKDGGSIDARDLKDIAAAVAIIFKESRLEFGEPTEITDIQSKGGAVSITDFTTFFQQLSRREKADDPATEGSD